MRTWRAFLVCVLLVACGAGTAFTREALLGEHGRIRRDQLPTAEVTYETGTTRVFTDGRPRLIRDGIEFKGHVLFKTAEAFLALAVDEPSASTDLRIYGLDGRERLHRNCRMVVNLAFSPNLRYAAFFDGDRLRVLDTMDLNESRHPAAQVFAVDDRGEAAFFDNAEERFRYRAAFLPMPERPSRICFFQGKAVATTRHEIFVCDGDGLRLAVQRPGVILEVEATCGALWAVERRDKPAVGETAYTLYETRDLNSFETIETRKMKAPQSDTSGERHGLAPPRAGAVAPAAEVPVADHEPILAPLQYGGSNLQLPMGNSYVEMQTYAGPYLHPGVDFLGVDYEPIYAVHGGVVKAILTTGGDAYWRVAIASENTATLTNGYLYAHLRRETIAVAVGDAVTAGQLVGKLYPWAPDFIHLHFARIRHSGTTWDGKWWCVNNPLIDVTNLRDETKPVMEKVNATQQFDFRSKDGTTYFNPTALTGEFDIIVKCHDLCNTTWKIGIYDLTVAVHPAADPGVTVLKETPVVFDIPTGHYAGAPAPWDKYFVRDGRYTSQCDGNNAARQYYHIVPNTIHTLPGGDYILEVIARDARLNASSASMTIRLIKPNTPPTISDIADRTIDEDTSTGPIGFTVGDAETPAAALTVSGTSSNTVLAPVANIVFGGSGTNRTVTMMPAADQYGSATITVTVTDGGGLTASDLFVLTVRPVPEEIQISLASGYNLIALPLTPATPLTAEGLAQQINEQEGTCTCTSVIGYEGGAFVTHPAGTALNNFPIVAGKGYFVRCSSASTWRARGDRFEVESATIALVEGYTLIGLPVEPAPAGKYTAEGAGQTINAQGGVATQLIDYDAATGQFVTHPVGTAVSNFTLGLGRGYFIRCTKGSAWTVTRS
jgi:hypothetical protein